MDHGRSLAWVTRLSDASPVPGAKIAVLDSCDGSEYWRGVTDASGRAVVADGLPEPDGYGSCDPQSGSHPLMVSARADDGYSLTLTTWNKVTARLLPRVLGLDAIDDFLRADEAFEELVPFGV